MQRRSSSSTEEDESETFLTNPRHFSNDQISSTFTSAKFDNSRQSETLDRRKIDKIDKVDKIDKIDKIPALHQLSEHGSNQDLAIHDVGKEQLKAVSDQVTKRKKCVQRKVKMELRQSEKSRSQLWRLSLLTLITTSISLILLWITLGSFFNRQIDPKGCIKPYMAPGYAKLDGFDTEHTRFASKYSLWLYREYGIQEDTNVLPHNPFSRIDLTWNRLMGSPFFS